MLSFFENMRLMIAKQFIQNDIQKINKEIMKNNNELFELYKRGNIRCKFLNNLI